MKKKGSFLAPFFYKQSKVLFSGDSLNLILFTFIVLLGFTSYYFGRKKAYTIQYTKKRLTALPQFYGYYLAIWCAIPAFIIFSLWAIFEPTIVKLLILSDYSNQGYLDD